MRKWRVVSAEGWGPGFSGANCTFRITRRTEFLGAEMRGERVSPQMPRHWLSPPTGAWGSWDPEGMVRPEGRLLLSPFVAFLF